MEVTFRINSDEVLWGQLETVLEGTMSEGFDGETNASALNGGTIYQANHQYRAKAKSGKWKKLEKIINIGGYDEKHLIFCHEDCDADEILERCKTVGFSWNPDFTKDVIFINRYDWGVHHQGKYEKFKRSDGEIFLVDKQWGLDIIGKANDILKCEDNDDDDDDDGSWYRTCIPLLEKLKCGSINKNLNINKINKNLYELTRNGNSCGVVDVTFREEEYIYGRLVFDSSRNLEALVVFLAFENPNVAENNEESQSGAEGENYSQSETEKYEKSQAAAESTEKSQAAAESTEKSQATAESTEKSQAAAESTEKSQAAAKSTEKSQAAAESTEKSQAAAESTEKSQAAAESTEKSQAAAESTEKSQTAAESTEKSQAAAASK